MLPFLGYILKCTFMNTVSNLFPQPQAIIQECIETDLNTLF